jgi:hypothetical protein
MNTELLKNLFQAYTAMAELPMQSDSIKSSMLSLKEQINIIIENNNADLSLSNSNNITSDVLMATVKTPTKEQSGEVLLLMEAYQGGDLLSLLLTEINISKSVFMSELGMGSSNATYLNQMLNGDKGISKKYATRFSDWFTTKGFLVPVEKFMTIKK